MLGRDGRGVVLCVGEAMALVVPAGAAPVETATAFQIDTAGAESNVACHVALAGHPAAWLGALGDDALGRRTRARIAATGVDVSDVTLDASARTGLMVKDPGRGVVYYRDASAASRLGPDAATRIDWDGVGVIHVSGITLALSDSCRALVEALVDAAATHGVPVSFDVNHRPALWATTEDAAATILAVARRADIVWVGRDEAERLWGTATADTLRALLPEPSHLIVKDADIEAVEFSAAGRVAVPARRVDVVEAVGAGDAFAGGWLAALLEGADSAHRLNRGHERAARVLASRWDVPRDDREEGRP